MGRKKSEIPKGSFSLKAAPNAKGERPIYLKYYVEGRYAKRSTDLWVLPDDWDEKKQEVKSKNKSAARLSGRPTPFLHRWGYHLEDRSRDAGRSVRS